MNSTTPNRSGLEDFRFQPYRLTIVSIMSLWVIPIIVTNMLVIAAVCRFRRLQTRTNIFALNLAIADLLVGLVIPLDAAFYLSESLNSNKYACLTRYMLFAVSLGSSVYSLLLISAERFIAIIHPLHYYRILTRRRVAMLIANGWVYVTIVSLLPIFGWNKWNDDILECDYMKIFPMPYIYMIYFSCALPLFLNLVLYVVVMQVAWKQIQKVRELEARFHQKATSTREVTSVKTMAFVLGIFFLCWLPYLVAGPLHLAHVSHSRTARNFTICLGMFNSCVNGIIYGLRNKDFRNAYRALLGCAKSTAQLQEEHTMVSMISVS